MVMLLFGREFSSIYFVIFLFYGIIVLQEIIYRIIGELYYDFIG